MLDEKKNMSLKKTLEFITKLNKNNNREWFNENKPSFKDAQNEFLDYISLMIDEISIFDKSVEYVEAKDCIFRIYRDVRFSKDKTPYKKHFAAYIALGGRKSPYAGYYIHIEPNNSFLCGGVYKPNSKDLKLIRYGILEYVEKYKSLLQNKDFCKYFDGVQGEVLKSAPRGFAKDLPNLELIKNKDYVIIHRVSDEFWIDKDVKNNILKVFNTQKEFNFFMNDLLDERI